jgi:hypothetical protein
MRLTDPTAPRVKQSWIADVEISNSLMNNVSKEAMLNKILDRANNLSGTYSRLKKLPNK